MKSTLTKLKSRDLLLIVLLLQCTLYAAPIFGIRILAQVVGFVYLTFVPGFIIIGLLRFDGLDGLETLLFSAGLSVAFMMIVALVVNEFGSSLGVSQPLSFAPLFVILNGLILLGAVVLYLRRSIIDLRSGESLALSPLGILFISLPVLSVVGAKWVNAYCSNSILMLLMMAIAALFSIGVIFKKLVPSTVYPFAMLMIAISLIYHSSLITNHLVSFGSDVYLEYSVFKTTASNAYWNPTPPLLVYESFRRVNAMLSITILPSVYSTLLGIDPAWVFKGLFPLIFSLVPLGLYRVWNTYVGKKYAFISAFLFMAQQTFYTEMLGLNRQMIAELFFVLLLLVTLNKKMKTVNRVTLFIIFSFALVASHYALAEIFLFFISSALISQIILSRILKRSSGNIAASMVVLFFVIMFAWYIYTSGSAVFDSFVSYGSNVYSQLGEFANPTSRGATVLTGLGLEEAPSIWNSIGRAFAYITEGLIAIGFLGLILKQTKIRFDMDYLMYASAAMVLLAALILVPGLANTLNMTRFYHILLFFLAPLCAVGAEVVVRLMLKQEKKLVISLLLLIVLMPYFLFQTGFAYEIVGTQSYSLPLSKHGISNIYLLVHLGDYDESEVVSALWISQNIDVYSSKTYADRGSTSLLLSYNMIVGSNLEVLSNVTTLSRNDNVYLNRANVLDGVVLGLNLWNTTDVSDIWKYANKIYTNRESEIYKEMIGQ